MREMLNNPFTIGLLLGLLVAGYVQWRNFMLKLELRRYKQHLSDRMELEAGAIRNAKTEVETLRKENENLRIRIAEFNQLPEWRTQRELEIYARAEKQLLVNVPGFAPAWEGAKKVAHEELQTEESGRSLPKRVFSRLFGLGGGSGAGTSGASGAELTPQALPGNTAPPMQTPTPSIENGGKEPRA